MVWAWLWKKTLIGWWNNNNNNNNQRQCLWCCPHDHGHCESSPGSFDECRLSAGWPPTLRPSQPTWAVSNVKVKDRMPNKELRERLGIDHVILVLQQNRLRWLMCCEKKTLIGWRNVWNMRWRAPDQEVAQRERGERLCKKIAKGVIWTGSMLWIVVDGRSW